MRNETFYGDGHIEQQIKWPLPILRLSLKNQRFFAVIECDYRDNKAQGKATGNQNVIWEFLWSWNSIEIKFEKLRHVLKPTSHRPLIRKSPKTASRSSEKR